jgi:DNA-binding winged helix-turn-helix (wHTH) protein
MRIRAQTLPANANTLVYTDRVVSGMSSVNNDGTAAYTHIRFGSCVLDVHSRLLYRDGVEVTLPPRALELLKVLIEQAPKALTKAELLDLLWPDTFVSEDTLAKLVSDLRALIGDSARRPRFIRTVHGFGYAFSAGVEDEPSSTSQRLTWAGRDFLLHEGENIIGRDPDVAVPINASIVSRRHARVTVHHGFAQVEDLGSKNGTFVGSERIGEARPLRNGDVIRIGDYQITYRTTPVNAATVTRRT